MRVVFLDFDGVLNSHEYLRERAAESERGRIMGIDRVAVERLDALLFETGAEIVVSSSWRHGRSCAELRVILGQAGCLHAVRGKTPDCATKPDGSLWHGAMRGHEIQAWLSGAELYGIHVESFVILDDDSDMAHLAHRHVKTSMDRGLTTADVERAVMMLRTPEPTIVLAGAVPFDGGPTFT